MEEGFEEELRLARLIKNDCCKLSNWMFVETKPDKAAEILHRIGLIYKRRSPNKISLLKSVGLLNAAICRNPIAMSQIRDDLQAICKYILVQAKAELQSADLVKKACQVKVVVQELRQEIHQTLCSKLPMLEHQNIYPSIISKIVDKIMRHQNPKASKIDTIRNLNEKIALKYTAIMADLGHFCEDVMGKPPCEFAIAGMGSLARCEITPYSDFEHIILLNDANFNDYSLEYFRWFTVIFHTVILNLQETIIPSLHIYSLNDRGSELGDWFFDTYTPRGISFDGMMPHACKFPLGRNTHTCAKPFETELIKPVSKMLEYLSSEADLKNGYHLADILTNTCFVYGKKNIFDCFQTGVKNYLCCKSKQERIEQVKVLAREDLDSFCARFRLAKLRTYDTINIKQFVYRSSTIFISALARIHNILKNSSFDVIDKMASIKVISNNAKNELCFAIAIACEMRLRVYEERRSQSDTIIGLKQKGEVIDKFLNIVGVTSTINYFQITYCLQCEVAKHLKLTKLHFYSDPQLINFTIGLAFGMTAGLPKIFANNRLKNSWNLNNFDFDACIEQLKKTSKFDHVTNIKDATICTKAMKFLADHLYSTKIYDEAIEFYQQLLQDYVAKSSSKSDDENIAMTYVSLGNCLNGLRRPHEGLKYYQKALAVFENITTNSMEDRNIAMTLNNIGNCLCEMREFHDALIYFKQSLQIKQNISHDLQKDGDVAMTLNNIGLCLMDIHHYDDALIYLKQALEIYQIVSLERKEGDVAMTLNNIGNCLRNMHQYDDALNHLKKSLEIYENLSVDYWKDSDVALILLNIGSCLNDMHRYDDALVHYKQSLKIKKNILLDERRDSDFANTLNNIGVCLKNMHQYDEALIYLEQSLDIYLCISLDDESIDRNIAGTYRRIDRNIDERIDRNIAGTRNNIGICMRNMHLYDEALIHLKQSLEIFACISLDEQKDTSIAIVLNSIGLCLKEMHQYCDALPYFNRALSIYKALPLTETTASVIARVGILIRLCNAAI